MTGLISYINGTYLPAAAACLPLNDLGLLRGYGVFDYLRTYNGVPFRLREHLGRLQTSARLIGLDLPWSTDELEGIVYEILRRNELPEAGIRLVVTGGPSADSIMPSGEPTLIVTVAPITEPQAIDFEQGVKVVTARIERFLPHAKTLNYISAIMALGQARRENAVEALYVDERDHVLEGTRTNFFAFQAGKLLTPCDGVLDGITRNVVLELAQGHLETMLRPIDYGEIATFEEAFMTSTTKEVMPIVQIDDQVIGSGKPGPNTRLLMELFRGFTRSIERNTLAQTPS